MTGTEVTGHELHQGAGGCTSQQKRWWTQGGQGGWKSTFDKDEKESAEELGSSETILYDTIMVRHLSKLRVYDAMSEP